MILLLLHIIISACLLVTVLSVYIPTSLLPVPTWFGVAFEWLLIAELVVGFLLLFTKRRRWCWLTVLMLMLSGAPISYTWSHRSLFFPKRELPNSFTLMTYNVGRMDEGRKADKNRIVQYILTTQPDVVCLQELEVFKSEKRLTLAGLKEALNCYPYTYFDFKTYNRRHQFGVAVFSKYPLIDKHTLRYESRGNITGVCDIVLPTDTIRLYNTHLESNNLVPKDLTISHSTEETQSTVTNTSAKLDNAAQIRVLQAKILHSDAERSPYPVLIVGDMNTTPASYTYRVLRRGMRDAFLESSDGQLGHSFVIRPNPQSRINYPGVGLRIDYVFHSPALAASDFRVQHVDYSDHYPVFTTIHY